MKQSGSPTETLEQVQVRLQHQINRQSLLLSVTQQLASDFDLSNNMVAVAEAVRESTGAESVRVVVNDLDGELQSFGVGANTERLHMLDSAVCELSASKDSSCVLQRGMPQFPKHDLPIHEIAIWPLNAGQVSQGCIWIAHNTPLHLDETTEHFISTLAGYAAQSIVHTQKFQHAQYGRKWLATILASSSDPVMVVNSEGRVSLLNHAAEDLLRLQSAAVRNQPVTDVLEPYPGLLEFFQNQSFVAEDAEWESSDGRVFSPRFSPVESDSGETHGYVLTLRDVTPFKLLNRNQEEFIRLVSHDLRSPLTFMRGFADLVGMVGELNDQQIGFLEKIQSGIHQITTLVDNIQDAGRWDPQSGFYEMNREPVDLTRTLQDIVSNHQNHAEKSGVRLVADIAPNIPIVNVDNLMIERALINLVMNAIKYSPDGGEVKTSMKVEGNDLIICISDTGLGIASENLGQLFQRGARIVTEEIKKNRIKGSGLGLFIVRSVALRHNGDVRVESTLGEGSSFYFTIPLEGANLVGSI